jgi:hypothetical protein
VRSFPLFRAFYLSQNLDLLTAVILVIFNTGCKVVEVERGGIA